MTNGETFFLVAVIMVLLLGPFLFMIIALLRHSKETYEVCYKAKSFTNPWPQYFASLDIFFAGFLTFLGCLMLKAIFSIRSNSSSIPDWGSYLLLSLIGLFMLFLAAYIYALTINHWKHTKDVIIKFDPEKKVIFVENSFAKYELGEGDIESVDIYSNEKKLLFLYYRLKIRNKQDLILTGNTRGVFGIFEFFKTIPIQYHRQQFPIIR